MRRITVMYRPEAYDEPTLACDFLDLSLFPYETSNRFMLTREDH